MSLRKLFIIILQLTGTQMYRHHKPLAEKIWSEQCAKNSIVLNDCNWCRCNNKQKYDCKARVCEEIDMFGHFKDAIQEINVGMEGRGSWRSKSTYCTPGVHYRRGAVLCVCDEDGNWPNPVCRDLFQILHSVEVAGQTRLSKNESCTPTKLYLVGCNVCFCSSSGYLDPELCTDKECEDDDPILQINSPPLSKVQQNNNNVEEKVKEIYATCDSKYEYELGCRICNCLINNRLLCDNCTTRTNTITSDQNSNHLRGWISQKKARSICKTKVRGLVFRIKCNLCYCSKQSNLFCTLKKCINSRAVRLQFNNIKFNSTYKRKLQLVDKPPDDQSCIPGTVYKRKCNKCVCTKLSNGVKAIRCTSSKCSKNPINIQKTDCVNGTYYEENCMLCHCYIENNIKYKECRLNEECVKKIEFKEKKLSGSELIDINSLTGYCKPMHLYKKDCNKCRCLGNGKIVECTSNICPERSSSALSVDVVPVEMDLGENCPKGHSYRLDCNICFCLANGNAICTVSICSTETNKSK